MKVKTSLTILLLFLAVHLYGQAIEFSSGDFDFEVYEPELSLVRLKALDGTLRGEIEIPDSVSYKGKTYAVKQIYDLGDNPDVLSVKIPKTVSTVNSLSSLAGLQNIYVDEANSYYKSIDGVLVDTKYMSLTVFPQGRRGEYKVPEGIERISTSFHSGITKLTIPSSVKIVTSDIGRYVQEFDVAVDNETFSSVDGALCSKDGKTLIAYPASGKSMASIPSSIDSIGTYAFTQRISIIINRSTPLAIGHRSYYEYNTNIIGIYIKSSNLKNFQESSQTSKYDLYGYDVIKDNILYVKNGDADATVVGSYSQSDDIELPQTVTDEMGNTYNVTKIGRKAFFQNSTLTNIKLPEKLNSIGDSAFYNTSISEISLPASLTEIGINAFYYCYNLNYVYAECAPIDISRGCFYRYRTLYVLSKYEDQYRSAIGWSSFSSIIVKDFGFGDFLLKKLSEETVAVTGYSGTQTDIIIPDEVTVDNKNYKITAIGESAFQSKNLSSIQLPSFLEEIGANAFRYNYNLTSIVFPISLRIIGNRAFYNCYLSTLNIPSSVESIGDYAFASNYNLKTVIVHNQDPFKLGSSPFYSGNGLKIVIMPSVSADAYKTAANWQNYRNYIYGIDGIVDDMAYLKQDDNSVALLCCLKTYVDNEYNKFTIPAKVNIDGVTYNITSIGDGAFNTAYYLNELTIPETIKSIGSRAFNNTILRFESQTPPKTNNQTFSYYPKKVIVPLAALDLYKETDNWKNISYLIMAYDILIDDIAYLISDDSHVSVCGVLSIPKNKILEVPEKIEFNNKEYIVSIVGSNAFSSTSGLFLSLPESVDSIGSDANFGSFSITYLKSTTPPRLASYNYSNVYVPSSALNSYLNDEKWVSGEWHKRYIHGTDGIIINDGVLYNINNNFMTAELCAWMKESTDSINVPATVLLNGNDYSVTSLRERAFDNYNNIKYFKIPETITEIGAYVIPWSSNMIIIADGLIPPRIGSQNNSNIERYSLYVKSSAYDYYKYADVWKDFGDIVPIDASDDQFYYAKSDNGNAVVTGLKITTETEFKIPESVVINGETLKVTQIGSKLFANNRNVKKIILPNTLEEIGDNAFFGSSLQQIALPASVNNIGKRAFSINPENYSYSSLNKIQVRAGNEYFMQRDESMLLTKDGKRLMQMARNGGQLDYVWTYDEKGKYSRMEINPFNGIEQIAEGALDGCQAEKIKLPASLSDADASMFMHMQYLSSIEVDTLHNKLHSIDGVLFSKDTVSIVYFPYTKSRYSDYRNYELPEKVQIIARLAFYNSQFETLTLSDSLKTIADSAFFSSNRYSNQIGSLILMNEKIAMATETSFNDQIYQNTILYVPMGTQNDYITTWPWYNFRNINSSKLAEEDFLLLKSFYEEMGNGEGWYRQWTFGATADETRITRGIKMIDEHVYSIDLSGNGLKGGLSDKLFKLPRLEILNLSNNELSCPIDSVLDKENIDNNVLRELNISYNKLTGNIGSVANTLKNLTTLDARNNKLSKVSPMLSTSIYSLSLYNQEISDTLNYTSWYSDINSIPTLLLYNHESQNYNKTLRIESKEADPYWSARVAFNNMSPSLISFSSSIYKLPNNSIFTITDNSTYNNALLKMTFRMGDVDFNNTIDISDLQKMINFAFEESSNSLFNYTAANLYSDDLINVQDVVCEVNEILEEPVVNNARSAARSKKRISESSDVILYWRDNYLIMESKKEVASVDLSVSNADDFVVLLNEKNYSSNKKTSGKYVRTVIYSLAGTIITPGETIIARVSGKNPSITNVLIVDKQGEVLTVSVNNNNTTSIVEKEDDILSISLSSGDLRLSSQTSLKDVSWAVYSLDGSTIASSHVDVINAGDNHIPLPPFTDKTVIVRVVCDKFRVVKKISYSKQ